MREEMSLGRQEAFEIFKRDHADSVTVDDNKQILKQRFSEAKALGESINEARSKIGRLKEEITQRHKQHVALGISESMGVSEPDLQEEQLRTQLEEEKRRYKTMFTRLKALKVEIEHLQLLMDKAKVKLQKEFEVWWAEEATNLQVSSPASNSLRQEKPLSQPSSSQRDGLQLPSHRRSECAVDFTYTNVSAHPHWDTAATATAATATAFTAVALPNRVALIKPAPALASPPIRWAQGLEEPYALLRDTLLQELVDTTDRAPLPCLFSGFVCCSDRSSRKHPPSLCSSPCSPGQSSSDTRRESSPPERPVSSIPLTGDRQTDSDILAFIKARQSILQRKLCSGLSGLHGALITRNLRLPRAQRR
ncbi:kinesin-like protein KIF6 [Dipodomys spectabilis]|uniref:kinesin-like protein KIF6 n=1 Tax=Dipodomys spectabilis TaxID=105255 RepID=UPI001C548574|nr:kinesin-like protein KIF6 [Dipodomys spectabilis]